jgi:L-rhamnose mutarotase
MVNIISIIVGNELPTRYPYECQWIQDKGSEFLGSDFANHYQNLYNEIKNWIKESGITNYNWEFTNRDSFVVTKISYSEREQKITNILSKVISFEYKEDLLAFKLKFNL